MALRIIRRLRDQLDVLLTSPADGEVLTYDDASSKWVNAAGGAGGGAPTDADYLVGTTNGSLSGEIVVGTSPGGELGGTWATPTVDATHSGSSHASIQAAAEATAASALSTHASDMTGVHGLADTADVVLTGDARLSDARAPTGAAGGSLTGTYPNPTFAVDMATQAELDAVAAAKANTAHNHAGEDITSGTVADARIAASIARDSEVTTAANAAQAAAEATAASALSGHTGDTAAAHAASAISADSTTLVGTGTDVQAVLEELDNAVAAAGGGTADFNRIFMLMGA